MRHLHGLGHRRIATIAGPQDHKPGADRMVGFRAELQALGLESHPEYEQVGDWYTESGERAMQALLALPEPPTAVFAAADLMAVGAMKAARDAGLDVPEDLAVVGFDDIQLASLLNPALTTIHQDKVGLGRAAARALLDQIENPDIEPGCADAAGGAHRPRIVRMDKGGGRSNNHHQGSHRGTNTRRKRMKSILKRRGRLVLVAAVVAVLATASGLSVKGASAAKRSNVTLTIDVFGDFGYHDLYKQYEASHPGITIKEDTEDYAGHHTALAQHLATGAGADDIEAIEVGFIANYTTQPRYFVDLRKYGASKLKKRYPNWKYQQAVAHNKKVIGLGTDVGSLGICYRTDLFKKAGLPTKPATLGKMWKTWSDFLAVGKRYQKHAPAGTKFIDSGSNLFNAIDRAGHPRLLLEERQGDRQEQPTDQVRLEHDDAGDQAPARTRGSSPSTPTGTPASRTGRSRPSPAPRG